MSISMNKCNCAMSVSGYPGYGGRGEAVTDPSLHAETCPCHDEARSEAEARNSLKEDPAKKYLLSCPHSHLDYLRTREDWFDGDETDIYKCRDCGTIIEEYIPR